MSVIFDFLKQRWKSLTFRILLYFFLALILLAVVLSVSFIKRIKPHFENDLRANLAQYVDYLTRDIGSPPNVKKAGELAKSLNLKIRIDGPDLNWASHPQTPQFKNLKLKSASESFSQYQYARHRHNFQLVTTVGEYHYLYMVDNHFRRDSERRYGLLFIMIGGGLILLFIAIQKLFKPIQTISGHFEQIGKGNFDKLDSRHFKGEFVDLSDGINRMSGQIEAMLDSKSALLLAISHELRSPLARMRINLELLDSNNGKEALIDDIQEIDQLLAVLLESERLNTSHEPIQLSLERIDSLIVSVITQYFSDTTITTELEELQANVDPMRFKLVVKNLIENSIRYSNPQDLSITVKLESISGNILFSVEDRGSGMSSEEVAQATDAFYRADSARSRNTGGYGLGLYLCRLIALAHGGSLDLTSKTGQGTTVIMKIPVVL